MLSEIISGSSDGAELAALEAAQENGFITGGFFSPNTNGLERIRAVKFGLISNRHPRKLRRFASDATLFISVNTNSVESAQKFFTKNGKPFLHVTPRYVTHSASQVANWLQCNTVQVLNILSDSGASEPSIEDFSKTFLYDVFQEMRLLGKFEVVQGRNPIWRERARRQLTSNESRTNTYTRFIDDPSEETLTSLKKNIYAWVFDVFCKHINNGNWETDPLNKISYLKTCTSAYDYIENRLRDCMSGRMEWDELLEGYSSLDKTEDFQFYVTSATLFYLWRNAVNEKDRHNFAMLMKQSAIPDLRRCLNKIQKNDRLPSWVIDNALDIFLDETNLDYLNNFSALPFSKFLKRLRKRIEWRWKDARRASMKQEFDYRSVEKEIGQGEVIADIWMNKRIGGGLVIRDIPGLRDLYDELQEQLHKIPNLLLDAACKMISEFPNTQGRRLFLLLMMGGISHKRRCNERSSVPHVTYLEQSSLIDSLSGNNPNFLNHWYRRRVNRDFVVEDVVREVLICLDEDFQENDLGLGDRIVLENNIHGWDLFLTICKHFFEEIKSERLIPDATGITTDRWAELFNKSVRLEPLVVNQFDQRQVQLANFTRFIIGRAKDMPENWQKAFEEFSEVQDG